MGFLVVEYPPLDITERCLMVILAVVYNVTMARNENGKGFSLRDHLFNRQKVTYLGELLARADHKFDAEAFVKKVMSKLKQLELKQRIVWIAQVLEEQLPQDFTEATSIIVKALPPPLNPEKTDNDFGSFIFAPFGEYVVRNGREPQYVPLSLSTIKAITQRFSMEDAIRYFINEYEAQTLAALDVWASDRHYHVRRLVSEGTRPLLPWSGRLKMQLEKAIPLLDKLYFDGTRYVTRSVANHMNDIAKKNPALALDTLKRWHAEGKQAPEEMAWMTRHSLRTLIKQGNVDALQLLGYGTKPKINVENLIVAPHAALLQLGQHLEFSFTIHAREAGDLMIDYIIDFQKANNKTAARVFKLKKLRLKRGDAVLLKKRHLFPPDSTTLRFYPGKHTLTLQINGQQFGSVDFDLS